MALFGRGKRITELENANRELERSFDAWRFVQPYIAPSWSGVYVSDKTALAIPAFYSGMAYVCDTIGSWKLEAYRGDTKMDPNPPILDRPGFPDTRMTTVAQMVASLILRGDVFALLGKHDRFGYPAVLKVLDPRNVSVMQNAD